MEEASKEQTFRFHSGIVEWNEKEKRETESTGSVGTAKGRSVEAAIEPYAREEGSSRNINDVPRRCFRAPTNTRIIIVPTSVLTFSDRTVSDVFVPPHKYTYDTYESITVRRNTCPRDIPLLRAPREYRLSRRGMVSEGLSTLHNDVYRRAAGLTPRRLEGNNRFEGKYLTLFRAMFR